MTSKDKALSKRKEYMGNEKKEEEGKLKEGKEKATSDDKDPIKPFKLCPTCKKKIKDCNCD